MEIRFSKEAEKHYQFWQKNDKKIVNKIFALIKNIQETPYEGIGKPEQLKHELSYYWARRIDKKHRLVYFLDTEVIIIVSCKGHYD